MSSVLNDNLDKVKRGALSGAMAIEWLYSVTGFSFVLVSCWVGLVILPLRADDWGAAVVVSSTLGVHGNRICIGEATRGDLGCPTYAPSLTTAGDISVTGNLSAAKFLGDGSGLTNLAASNISVTTGASGSLVYRDAYGSLMASAGLSISSTTGSVGIGADAPQTSATPVSSYPAASALPRTT